MSTNSVIGSARTTVTTTFNLISHTALAADKLVRSAALSIDALEARAALMRDSVITDCRLEATNYHDEAITKAALKHTENMESIHASIYPGKPFDKEAFYLQALSKMQASANPANSTSANP